MAALNDGNIRATMKRLFHGSLSTDKCLKSWELRPSPDSYFDSKNRLEVGSKSIATLHFEAFDFVIYTNCK